MQMVSRGLGEHAAHIGRRYALAACNLVVNLPPRGSAVESLPGQPSVVVIVRVDSVCTRLAKFSISIMDIQLSLGVVVVSTGRHDFKVQNILYWRQRG
jgi:hypothetical protein